MNTTTKAGLILLISSIFFISGGCFQTSASFADEAAIEEPAAEEPTTEESALEEPTEAESEPAAQDDSISAETPAVQTISGPKKFTKKITSKSFSLKQKGKTKLTYKVSNSRIAKVSSKGKVTIKGKPGKVTITVKAAASKKYASATKKIVLRVKDVYHKPRGWIGEASGDERHRLTGGRPGDQTKSEIRTTSYYYAAGKHWRNWKYVIRCTDPQKANEAAHFVEVLCENDRIGYNNYVNNQKGINQRDSLYKAAKKADFKAAKIKTKVDVSCTPLCMTAFCSTGIDMHWKLRARYTCKETGTYTGTYRCRTVNAEALKTAIKLVNKQYQKQGKKAPFKIIDMSPYKFRHPKKYLKRGDVLCTGKHTAMVY